MYKIEVTNHYPYPVKVGSHSLNTGDSYGTKANLGNIIVEIPGIGAITFIDLGTEKIGGSSDKKYGVLISLHGEELVFRYEDTGHIGFAISQYGQMVTISGNGDFNKIKLPTFIFFP